MIDLYSVQPVDRAALISAARQTRNRIVTVEDHYAAGGIRDVAEAVSSRASMFIVLPFAKFHEAAAPKRCSTSLELVSGRLWTPCGPRFRSARHC